MEHSPFSITELKNILQHLLSPKILDVLRESADALNYEVRIVGGVVRDILLNRATTDFDFVTEGSGTLLAEEVAKRLGKGAHLAQFQNFGTAQVSYYGVELEFVGARKESYQRNSRKPIVEKGTFRDDEERRDFTINALSIPLNGANAYTIHDPFDGLYDLKRSIIQTPLDPDITFSDDPLRMMRAVRFACQLNFDITPVAMDSIRRNAERLKIVSPERIETEFMKIIQSERPSVGLRLMDTCGLMEQYLPEISALKGVETKEGIGHKDNFTHTLIVVDQLAEKSNSPYLRLAALFHDIGKPNTKKFTPGIGWSFHNHDFVGAKLTGRIFRRCKFPLDDRMKYVQKLVKMHMRPGQLADDGVTDSAIRRLLFEAGDDIDDLMLLCESDLTSKNPAKVRKYLNNFQIVRQKLKDIEEKDRIRNFQPPVTGDEIMALYHLPPCREVGTIKERIKDAILDGVIPNDRDAALAFMQDLVERENILPR